MLPKVLKNFNLFIDGRGYAGRVEEVTLPKLTIKTEEYHMGGLDTPVQVDMGMDKLECEFTLSEYDTEVIKLFGIANRSETPGVLQGGSSSTSTNVITNLPGLIDDGYIPFTLRGGLSDEVENKIIPVIVSLVGRLNELDFGQWKAGENAQLRIRLALRYYRLAIAEVTLVEIDVNNKLRKINGVDQVGVLNG